MCDEIFRVVPRRSDPLMETEETPGRDSGESRADTTGRKERKEGRK